MNPYIQETIDAHVAIEHWLSHKQGAVEALMARFSPDFQWLVSVETSWTTGRSALSLRPRAAVVQA